jgi:hypothetical protein
MTNTISHAVRATVRTATLGTALTLAWAGAATAAPAIPVAVTNTPSVNVVNAVNVNATLAGTPTVKVANTVGAPIIVQDANRAASHLVSDAKAFAVPLNPNVAFEFLVPANVVLTDVNLTLNLPAQAVTLFVADLADNNKTWVFQSVGSPGSTWAGSTSGQASYQFASGLTSASGIRVGITCNNIGGTLNNDIGNGVQGCAGALSWSGYTN